MREVRLAFPRALTSPQLHPHPEGTCEMRTQHSLSMNPFRMVRAHSRAPSRQRIAWECCPWRQWMAPRL